MSLTARQIYAMSAPEVPEWYKNTFTRNTIKYEGILDHEKLFFAWREYYADQMIERFGDGDVVMIQTEKTG